MRGAPTDNGAQCDHCIVFAGVSQHACSQRQLVSARDPDNGDVVVSNLTNALECVDGTLQQAVVDEVVETRNGDGDASVRGSNSSFNNVHTLPLRVHLAPQGGGFYHNTSRTASLFQKASRRG
ncbi:hypothetical protein D3C77_623870 [compost metagenome]